MGNKLIIAFGDFAYVPNLFSLFVREFADRPNRSFFNLFSISVRLGDTV
jgi:hypothetical protein